ncbi:uncharacterized protein RJT20DRAFT_140711 [Scheffersomyces xylosifermentans]|uniref:uncharacterized protein n=1 Tax=Scheffersomyces xylosifermentans TaxID=1304137 RepID=UPI00315DA01E
MIYFDHNMSSYLPQEEFGETNIYDYDESPENKSWASALPVAQGLYNPELEKDACGVGFTCHLKGVASHKIVSDCRNLLCNMTHRGGELNPKDGDGAGLLSSIPHNFFKREFKYACEVDLPPPGQYGTGNLFFKKDESVFEKSKTTFESIAESLGLKVLGWRKVPHDSSILGPASLSREPFILQPAIVLNELVGEALSAEDFEKKYQKDFEKKLFILRKQSSHTIGLHNWFYICSLSNKTIVYKGQLAPNQVYAYYHDLVNADYECHFALVHSRFSTNTFPSWDRAQPLRFAAHNGEINTLRGNKNWMRAKEGVMTSKLFGDELDKLYPIIEEGGSDSAAFDNVLELLVMNGVLSLPEAVMMMIPEAWQNDKHIDPKKRAFYEWAACLMEPWDGPALFTFADDRYCGANLDRNGLRPCRYYVTDDDRVICASEVGVLEIAPEKILQKGRLQPGRMLLVDTKEGRIVDDRELKKNVAARFDFKSWVLGSMISLADLIEKLEARGIDLSHKIQDTTTTVQTDPRLIAFGYSHEQASLVLAPMAEGKEALGSMGNDNALACISEQPKLLYDYFRQLFAQVTNPPIDPIREEIVMSLECYVGPQGNLLEMNPQQCNRLLLKSPILSTSELNAIRQIETVYPKWSVTEIDITFEKSQGIQGYINTIDRICQAASQAIADNHQVIILSDKATSANRLPISALIATGAVHHHLVRQKQRSKVALIIESAEAREVHHACCLVGYGIDGINPYLALETLVRMKEEGLLKNDALTSQKIVDNYKYAVDAGILKVMSKMGISTLASYKGAQIFEALGIDNSVIDRCFAGTASRIKGVTFEYIAQDAFSMHERGYPTRETIKPIGLPETGEYHWRDGGDAHVNEPAAIASMQDAVRNKNEKAFEAYSKKEYEAIKNCTLRGLLDFDYENSTAVPIDQVEPWTEIVRRFFTGAMSYGSISMEAHSTIAVAMNRLGGKSNTGEGGEDSARSIVNPNGDTMRSAIKQIASGRFGVTSHYLADADELQIKMAQGAKPGEGGELPGHKVSEQIGKTRHSTPGVGLISPPPHHDIYSIEDLKQLLYDLKCANPRARTSVKLVSEVGVGIVAAGVAKAGSENILVSGGDGGTGAAKLTSIKYAGLPWELGLAESHQTLVLNDLRGRVVLQTDGQIRTGRDIAVACLLGAEEWGFATTPLIAMGCIMMRKCLASGTVVRTTEGDKFVEEVEIGDYLLDGDDKPVLVIGANEAESGKLKEIKYQDFDSEETVSFKCTPDHHLELMVTGAAPSLSGNTVTWFSRCSDEPIREEVTDIYLDNILNSFYTDLIDRDDGEVDVKDLHDAVDVALDEHYHRGGSDKYSAQLDEFIRRIVREDLAGEQEFVSEAIHDAITSFVPASHMGLEKQLTADQSFALTNVSVDIPQANSDQLEEVSHGLSDSICQCGGVRKISRHFTTPEDALLAHSLLLSDNYHKVDPRFVADGYTFQTSVEEYETMCAKENLNIYRAPINFTETKLSSGRSELPVDPYFLGLWIGDGSSDDSSISTSDREVVVWLKSYVDHLNSTRPEGEVALKLTKAVSKSAQHGEIHHYRISGSWNPVYDGLKKLDLLNNKSKGIPSEYMNADEQSRLAVIAGLIDSDGCYVKSHNSYRFAQQTEEHGKIVYDLKELATSCGISTTGVGKRIEGANEVVSHITYLGKGSKQFQDALLIPRKRMTLNKSHYTNEARPFTVSDSADGEFRAIEVSGGQFQLSNRLVVANCHLNTCPVGIATQDPDLRKKFEGTPEHVINFFYYMSNELRGIMAKLGFRTVNEMIGRTEKLKVREDLRNTKNANIDLSPILTPAYTIRPGVATYCVRKQDHRLHIRLDNKLIDESELTLAKGLPVTIECDVVNTDRSLGTTLSYRVSKIFGEQGLPHDTIHVNCTGSAGQSFGAFLAPGITLELEGDANDYIGKGLSGGRIIVYPPKESKFKAEDQIIAGNTAFFGATSGTAFIRGVAAERFAVRNSGATIVTEGTGDHGCEYMSGGRVVVLGGTGRNFAAGMCGGIAYVLDMGQDFNTRVNANTVELSQVTEPTEIAFLRGLIEDHRHYTNSEVADRILNDFNRILPRFVKVLPYDYKKVLEKEKKKAEEAKKSELNSFFKSIKEDPEADVTNGEAAKIKKGHVHRPSTTVSAKDGHKEPKVLDVEDTILDIENEKKAPVKLDKLRGFMKYKRRNEKYRDAKDRAKDWNEMTSRLSKEELKTETARCMDCGVPFCTSDTGCPISNVIPKWNELVFQNRWYDALQRLMMTNNFPEFTGRICPAPCNGACVLGINEDPVNIKSVECAIIDHGFEQGWIKPQPPTHRTGKTVAIIGSGPSGLASADQLNKAGHTVTVYERSDRPGGLLMYGIPNMKLDKKIVKRRTDLLAAEGIEFRTGVTVGEDITVEELKANHDAVIFAVGSTIPRDLRIPGRELKNINFAMQLLHSNTKALLDDQLEDIRKQLNGKHVVVIGGGDTGNDCLGTSTRHGAKSVTNFELLPHPPAARPKDNPWPQWPRIFRVDYGHTEVAAHYGKDPREYSILSKEFVDDGEGNVKGIKTVRVEWKRSDTGAWQMAEVPGSEEFFPADVVLLSMGFIGPDADNLEVTKTKRGTITTVDPNVYRVSQDDNLFAAGDCRRGQSLVVWGIQEGRQCAREVDNFLMGSSRLPGNGSIEQRNYKLLEELAEKV